MPLWWLLVASTKSNADLFSTFGLWFADFNLIENIKTVLTFQDGVFIRWVGQLGASTPWSARSAPRSWPPPPATPSPSTSSRAEPRCSSIILGAIMIPTAALTVPTYLLFARAELTDTYWAIILPSLVSPFGVFLMRVYAADAVDTSLIEAGRVDGVGEIRIFFTIAFRLLLPGSVTVLLFALGRDLEQLLPAADHAQLTGEVPAAGRPGAVAVDRQPAAPAPRPCSPP